MNNSVNVFINTYPSILFFSAYFVILFLWIEVFHFTTSETKGESIKQGKTVYIIINVVLHLVFWVFFLVDYLTVRSLSHSFCSPSLRYIALVR